MLENTSSNHLPAKIFTMVIGIVIAAVVGYLAVYWWVFKNFNEVLNVGALKNQIVSTQKAGEVKDQLKELGYDFKESDFYQLNSPTSTNYRANVLDGYEPKKIESEEVKDEGYYFYDKNGEAFFFEVDADNRIDIDSLVPLITE